MPTRKMKIALFGGSFNPPHLGHVQIVEYILGKGTFDRIWVIPCFRHPFGKKLAPFWDRLKMTRLALKNFGETVRVLDLERRIGGVSLTWRTIKCLKKSYPNVEFTLVIGADQEKNKWKYFDRISQAVTLLEIPRGPDSPVTDISSSEVRGSITKGRPQSAQLSDVVFRYIRKKSIYSYGVH